MAYCTLSPVFVWSRLTHLIPDFHNWWHIAHWILQTDCWCQTSARKMAANVPRQPGAESLSRLHKCRDLYRRCMYTCTAPQNMEYNASEKIKSQLRQTHLTTTSWKCLQALNYLWINMLPEPVLLGMLWETTMLAIPNYDDTVFLTACVHV